MRRWFLRLTDSNTFLGNAVLVGLVVAVIIVWSCFIGGCAVDSYGLSVADGQGEDRVRTGAPAGSDVSPEVIGPSMPPPVQDAAASPASVDMQPAPPPPDVLPVVADASVPDVMLAPPDTTPPLRELGDGCARADQCASGVCAKLSGGGGICCDRACEAPCGQCSASGVCKRRPDGDACGPTSCNTKAPFDEISNVCMAGACVERHQDCHGFRCFNDHNVQELRGCWQGSCQVVGGYRCNAGTVCKDDPTWQGCVAP